MFLLAISVSLSFFSCSSDDDSQNENHPIIDTGKKLRFVSDPDGNNYKFYYNQNGQLIEKKCTYPTKARTVFDYYENKLLKSRTDYDDEGILSHISNYDWQSELKANEISIDFGMNRRDTTYIELEFSTDQLIKKQTFSKKSNDNTGIVTTGIGEYMHNNLGNLTEYSYTDYTNGSPNPSNSYKFIITSWDEGKKPLYRLFYWDRFWMPNYHESKNNPRIWHLESVSDEYEFVYTYDDEGNVIRTRFPQTSERYFLLYE